MTFDFVELGPQKLALVGRNKQPPHPVRKAWATRLLKVSLELFLKAFLRELNRDI